MQVIRSPGSLRTVIREARCNGRSIGFVPTMGSLHAGHSCLMDEARKEVDLVVASVYVNPTQFGPAEDFHRYPRDLGHDRTMASGRGVDVLFVPAAEDMYPRGPGTQTVWVDAGALAAHLDGAARPGHFRGVATVVAKLFHMVDPDRAYFGQKDVQQAIIIERMVDDLAFSVIIRVIPTVREPDGLALSSRNIYLTPEERAGAPALYASLTAARDLITGGERDSVRIREAMQGMIMTMAPMARIEFIEITDLSTLALLDGCLTDDAVIALAVFFGSTRLIDNTIVRFEGGTPRFS